MIYIALAPLGERQRHSSQISPTLIETENDMVSIIIISKKETFESTSHHCIRLKIFLAFFKKNSMYVFDWPDMQN